MTARLKALIISPAGEVESFLGTFEGLKDCCGFEMAQAARVNGRHVYLICDEEARLRTPRPPFNALASFLADTPILGTAALVLRSRV